VEFGSLQDVHSAITDGDCSGRWHVTTTEEVDGVRMAQLLQEQASDPAFFELTADGEEVNPPNLVFIVQPASAEDTLFRVCEAEDGNLDEIYGADRYDVVETCHSLQEAQAYCADHYGLEQEHVPVV